VRRPTTENAVALHTWQNIVDSLAQNDHQSGQSQFDSLLSNVFSR
jgi:hypothetical protein